MAVNSSRKKHDCSHCAFLANIESIFVDGKTQGKALRKPQLVGLFTLPGWTGHSSFYCFACEFCEKLAVDYPHGYTSDGSRNGLLYLKCNHCNSQLVLYDRKFYEVEEVNAPPTFWQLFKEAFQARNSKT